jgi:hypothetical protein
VGTNGEKTGEKHFLLPVKEMGLKTPVFVFATGSHYIGLELLYSSNPPPK